MSNVTELRDRINNTLDDIIRYALDDNLTQALDYVAVLKLKVNRLERELKRLEEEEQ